MQLKNTFAGQDYKALAEKIEKELLSSFQSKGLNVSDIHINLKPNSGGSTPKVNVEMHIEV